jgi:ethanolamine transporter EutH
MFGVVSIVFSAFAGLVNYELNKIQYPGAPSNFIEISIVEAMIPFLLLAVLSFMVSTITSQAKLAGEKMTDKQIAADPKREADFEKEAEK